jgi:hypothetical protein
MKVTEKSALFPGLLTFLINIVHTYPPRDEVMEETWKREYNDGSLNQIYTFKFPSGFTGVSFSDAIIVLFNTFNVTLFGVFENGQKLLMNPGKEYLLREEDLALCMASGGDEMILRICLQFSEAQSVKSEIPENIIDRKSVV